MKINTSEKRKPPKHRFIGRFSQNGTLQFGGYTKMWLKDFMKENPNMAFEIKPLLPESKEQRGFFEASLCAVVAFYQEGMDHRNSDDIRKVREWLKQEFNSELVEISGKCHRVAQTTKNNLNDGFIEKIVAYIEENFAPPREVLDTNKYKYWRDVIFPNGGPDNYIDYLVEINVLKKT